LAEPVRLPIISEKQLARILTQMGFAKIRQKGSHMQFRKNDPMGTQVVTIPCHRKDLPRGTLLGILGQAGLSREIFLKLL
jgi:predicted RNA binding protein YcfA (HicA-like mRNA interferase family)